VQGHFSVPLDVYAPKINRVSVPTVGRHSFPYVTVNSVVPEGHGPSVHAPVEVIRNFWQTQVFPPLPSEIFVYSDMQSVQLVSESVHAEHGLLHASHDQDDVSSNSSLSHVSTHGMLAVVLSAASHGVLPQPESILLSPGHGLHSSAPRSMYSVASSQISSHGSLDALTDSFRSYASRTYS
jgi:hypothetical protein